jgi:hypothetical protein
VGREEPEHTKAEEHTDHQWLMERTERVEAPLGGSDVEDRRRAQHRAERHRGDENQADDGECCAGKETHTLCRGLRGVSVRAADSAEPVCGWNGLGLAFGNNDRPADDGEVHTPGLGTGRQSAGLPDPQRVGNGVAKRWSRQVHERLSPDLKE